MLIYCIYLQPIANGLQTTTTNLNRTSSQDNNDVSAKKAITVVDLDDDDDVTPTPTPTQIVVPSNQVRLISTNQLQQSQGVTYIVSSSNTGTTMSGGAMGSGANRFILARPQQPGQIVLARNGVIGTAIRQQQV